MPCFCCLSRIFSAICTCLICIAVIVYFSTALYEQLALTKSAEFAAAMSRRMARAAVQAAANNALAALNDTTTP